MPRLPDGETRLVLGIVRQFRDQRAPSGSNWQEFSGTRRCAVADTIEPESQINPILEDVPVSRREFLSVSLAGIVGVSLLWVAGCGSSQDGGDNGKKDKKGDGGGGGGY